MEPLDADGCDQFLEEWEKRIPKGGRFVDVQAGRSCERPNKAEAARFPQRPHAPAAS